MSIFYLLFDKLGPSHCNYQPCGLKMKNMPCLRTEKMCVLLNMVALLKLLTDWLISNRYWSLPGLREEAKEQGPARWGPSESPLQNVVCQLSRGQSQRMEGILASDPECTNPPLQVLTEMPCMEYLYIGAGIMSIKFQGHKHSVFNSEDIKSGTHLNFLRVSYLLTAHCKPFGKKKYRHTEIQQDREANKALNSIFLNVLERRFELNVQC